MDTSADGSVNGKKSGRSLVRSPSPNIASTKALIAPRRSAMVSPSSTARPSIWWNTGLCVASSASLRKHLPGLTTYSGSGRVSMARICTGEVWVRRTTPDVLLAVRPGHEERVLHLAGRVVGREVERVEVVPLGLDLRSLGHLVAHADEDVDQPLGQRRDRVPGAGRVPVPRQRDVDGLVDQDPAVPVGLQLGLPAAERLA